MKYPKMCPHCFGTYLHHFDCPSAKPESEPVIRPMVRNIGNG